MSIPSPGARFRQALKDESPLQVIGAVNASIMVFGLYLLLRAKPAA